MSITRNEEITVDLASPEIKTLRVHQYDVNSVHLTISCTNHGVPWEVPGTGVDAYFKAIKPDGTKYYTKQTISNGCVIVDFGEQLFTVEGTVYAEVELIQSNVILNTMPFRINVIKGTFSNDETVSEDELSVINEMIMELKSLTPITHDFIDSLFS